MSTWKTEKQCWTEKPSILDLLSQVDGVRLISRPDHQDLQGLHEAGVGIRLQVGEKRPKLDCPLVDARPVLQRRSRNRNQDLLDVPTAVAATTLTEGREGEARADSLHDLLSQVDGVRLVYRPDYQLDLQGEQEAGVGIFPQDGAKIPNWPNSSHNWSHVKKK